MDSIKAQDIIRHIFKDEDKGVAYVTGLSITDGVEVLTKVLPELIKKAQEKNNVNDEGYFNEIANVYRRIIVDKLLNADHLWTIYCDSTGYPYMVDDDIVVLYDYVGIDADALYKNMYLNDAIVIVSSTADGELSEELSEAVSGKNAGIVVVSCSEDVYMKGDFADCGDNIFYTDMSPTKARIMLVLLLDNKSDSGTFKNAFTRRRV